ncbi:dihydropteroate synthase [Aeromicrobium sp. YIM 150415]|uniref:dihydropteroate synthase n=1 Tax=Aeromicrobium sp. YIM 150415 TaxID=2803912 RepID=UPI0019644DA1|nr:dihydropteroate synthase [Aeromicrobium sp. YIM 150415]MBM9462998.1 dihydropteroate synthase [Aeromicrobium sp. YIM 150415]
MPALRLRGREVERDRALVMAIVNRTPDSFFDRGATFEPSRAIDAVARAIDEGADIVDIGGVKAGTGDEVTVTEEISRTVPFIETVRDRFPDVAVSIDTWRAEVGDAAVRAGADLLNDTWAGVDPALGVVAADHGCGYVCSHTGGVRPRTDPIRARYDDVVADVIDETTAAAERLAGLGVPREGILIDPTHDFGKNTFHGLELLRRTDELVATGWPVLMALSRKDFVGETLDLGVGDRLEGTLAATAIAAWKGAAVFRAHDIVATRRVLEMIATLRGERPVARPRRGLA